MRKQGHAKSFRRFHWKWLLLFSVLFAGLVWAMVTSNAPEATSALGLPPMTLWLVRTLQYAFPITLVVAVGVWIARQFTWTPHNR